MELTDHPLHRHSKEDTQEISIHKRELQQARKYLQCILQNSNDMVFATDVDGIVVSFSSGGEKALGYPWEEIAGETIRSLAVDPSEFDRLTTLSQENGSATRLEFPFQHRDGHTIYCDVSLIVLTNTEGQTVGTVGICRDITQ